MVDIERHLKKTPSYRQHTVLKHLSSDLAVAFEDMSEQGGGCRLSGTPGYSDNWCGEPSASPLCARNIQAMA